MHWSVTIGVSAIFIVFCMKRVAANANQRLLDELYRRSGTRRPEVRPVQFANQTVEVTLQLMLIQMIEVNEKQQLVTLHVWRHMEWQDYLFKWDPSDYEGIKRTAILMTDRWIPDLTYFKIVEQRLTMGQVFGLVNFDGRIEYVPQEIITIPCNFSAETFPFDEQVCIAEIGSWIHSKAKLIMKPRFGSLKMDLSYYIKNHHWNVTAADGIDYAFDYQDEEMYQVYRFPLKMRRTAALFTLVVLLPSCALFLLSLLCLYLPPDCPERLGIGLSVLLSYTLMLNIMVESTPPSEKVPQLGTFILFNISMLAVSIVCSAVTLKMAQKEPFTIANQAIQTVFTAATRLLCIKSERSVSIRPLTSSARVAARASNNDDVIRMHNSSPRRDDRRDGKKQMEVKFYVIAEIIDRVLLLLYAGGSSVAMIVIWAD